MYRTMYLKWSKLFRMSYELYLKYRTCLKFFNACLVYHSPCLNFCIR